MIVYALSVKVGITPLVHLGKVVNQSVVHLLLLDSTAGTKHSEIH